MSHGEADSSHGMEMTMAQDIHVRPFSPEDLDAATRVFVQAFAGEPWYEDWPSDSARRRIAAIIHAPGFLGVAAFKERDLVGFIVGRIEAYSTEDHFYLQEMCVLPEVQRQGIGKLMLAHLHRRLRAAGCQQIYLLTARESIAERFYRQNGFRPAGRVGVLVARLPDKERAIDLPLAQD